MTTVCMRERRQITLPVDLVTAAQLETNAVLEASYVNGIIQLVPVKPNKRRVDMRRFLGAAAASYGKSDAAMNQCVNDQRDSW